jgi:adenosine deaminase
MAPSCDSGGFVDALRAGDHAKLTAFPKADRHCHSLLGAGLPGIRAWAGAPIEEPPARMADFDAMREYCHRALYPFIRHRAGFEHTAQSTVAEAAEDGVRVLEMSLDVDLCRDYDRGLDGFLDFVRRLLGDSVPGMDFRPEIGLSRNRDPGLQAALAAECVDSGLFGSIDLYGNEQAREPRAYAALYRRAASRGLKLKAHVGEFGDARLMEQTLRVLGLHEIQHGVAAAGSPELVGLLRREHIRLNVCPSSNVALSVAPDLARHPIQALARSGVRVSINSDDKTIFGRSVTGEYRALFQAGTLSGAELEEIRIDSLRD